MEEVKNITTEKELLELLMEIMQEENITLYNTEQEE
jgi:hypothetical protein